MEIVDKIFCHVNRTKKLIEVPPQFGTAWVFEDDEEFKLACDIINNRNMKTALLNRKHSNDWISNLSNWLLSNQLV